MAWDEWEQLKARATEGRSAHMRLNQADTDAGAPGAAPGSYGELKVHNDDLSKVGERAFQLYDRLWNKARVAIPSSDRAAGDLTSQGFALGGGLQHVANRWEEQLRSLMDACAHISNHMRVTKKLHQGDEHFIQRKMSSIDVLDAGFDDRVGEPGKRNPVYGPQPGERKDS
ncbi:hypothetical protein GCM10018785_47770 [Streptomyces longispororuber]|uniref:AG1 protein n=1 Tax=Streptomyces longispororuber TaxID=68230 RepID=A0A918ZY16_9ACTN|nr:hypothetical protein [Streptomyces longispororuber]GHE74048.1 hypothetical protein GCM10018785_47770 [Streptomyces longispororuber]